MIDYILSALKFLFELWSNLPQKVKDNLIALIVELWDYTFREFFKANPGEAAA